MRVWCVHMWNGVVVCDYVGCGAVFMHVCVYEFVWCVFADVCVRGVRLCVYGVYLCICGPCVRAQHIGTHNTHVGTPKNNTHFLLSSIIPFFC